MKYFRTAYSLRTILFLLAILFPIAAIAHPVPHITVRGNFKSDSTATIQVEVDPRCFADDPEHAHYLKKRDLDRKSKAEREAYFTKAKKLIQTTLRFHLEPPDKVHLDFKFRFQEKAKAAPDSEGGIPIILVAQWKTQELAKVNSYQLENLKAGKFSVHFLNKVDGKKQKLNVLFPGEKSYRLDLTGTTKEHKGDVQKYPTVTTD